MKRYYFFIIFFGTFLCCISAISEKHIKDHLSQPNGSVTYIDEKLNYEEKQSMAESRMNMLCTLRSAGLSADVMNVPILEAQEGELHFPNESVCYQEVIRRKEMEYTEDGMLPTETDANRFCEEVLNSHSLEGYKLAATFEADMDNCLKCSYSFNYNNVNIFGGKQIIYFANLNVERVGQYLSFYVSTNGVEAVEYSKLCIQYKESGVCRMISSEEASLVLRDYLADIAIMQNGYYIAEISHAEIVYLPVLTYGSRITLYPVWLLDIEGLIYCEEENIELAHSYLVAGDSYRMIGVVQED